MAMICKMCGNTEEFRQDVSGQKYVQGTRYLDGEEEETDLEMNDEDDIEWEDEDAITCVDCDNEDIQEGLTEREVNQIIWEHTDKEGEWCEDELDETERDKKLGDKCIVENL